MSKLTQLPLVDTLSLDDILYVVDQPGSTPVSRGCTVAQILTLFGSTTLPEINVLNYGVKGDGTTDDTVKMQAAVNAAYDLGFAKVIIPNTIKNTYLLSATIYNTTVPDRGNIPVVTFVNTTTGQVTWNKPHLLNTGDPIMNQGYAWGGFAVKTQYYAFRVDALNIKYYDTQANALAGGVTGLQTFSTGVTTTGNIASGTNKLTVAAVLNAEKGTDVRVSGVVNGNGQIFIRSISGSTVTVNANVTGGAIGGTVTYVSSMDWRYYRTGIRFEVAEGVTIKKTAAFVGQALFNISNTYGVNWRGGRFEGNTPDVNASINPGDDGLRFNSNRLLLVESAQFFYFGDGFLRICSSTGDPVAATASHPNDGVGQTSVHIRKNYVNLCHQLSSTTNDYMHGGGSEIWIEGNTFENIRGSIKLANRVPGAQNIFFIDNIIKGSLDKGVEFDCLQNLFIDRNIISNVAGFGIFIVANNGTPAIVSGDGSGVTGFPFNNYKITNNFLINCGQNSGTAAMWFQLDGFADGFRFDFSNLEICRNQILNMSSTTSFGILVVDGSYRNFKIQDNIFDQFNGICAMSLSIRGSNTVGFINNIDVSENTITMNSSSGSSSAILIQQNGGTQFLNDIHLFRNKVYGLVQTVFKLGNLKNVYIEKTRASITTGNFWTTISGMSLQEVYLDNNKMKTGSTIGFGFTNINGLYLDKNLAETASGTSYNIGNTCQNVWFNVNNNQSKGGVPQFNQVPINSIGLGVKGRNEIGTGTPATGTWNKGDQIIVQDQPAAGNAGLYCISKGTAGTIPSATTGSSNGTTNTFVAASITNLAVGAYINLAGAWSGGRTVTAINQTTLGVTVDGAVPAGVTAQQITFVNPVFKTVSPIAA